MTNRLSNTIDNLEIIGESLLQIESSDSTALWDFLEQKSQGMGFTSLMAIGMGASPAPFRPATAELLALPGIQASFAVQSGVSLLDEQSILYSIPLRRDDRVVGVLGGVRDKQNMQELIRLDSFSGTGLTCIVDRTASVVISPIDLDPFLQLEHFFTEDPDGAVAQHIYRMNANIQAHRAGAFQFESVGGSNLILAYTPLQSYNWILLTMVPADVLSPRLDGYMGQTYLAVAGIILLMATMFLILFLYQRSYRWQFENAVFEEVCRTLRRLLDTVPGPMLGFHFNRGCRFFLICDKADRSIGFVKLKQLGDRPVYEIVFAIGEERLWGNGYGTAAIRAAIAKAFLELRVEKVIARIYSANSRSINSVRACGFCCEHRGKPLCRYSVTMTAYLHQLA